MQKDKPPLVDVLTLFDKVIQTYLETGTHLSENADIIHNNTYESVVEKNIKSLESELAADEFISMHYVHRIEPTSNQGMAKDKIKEAAELLLAIALRRQHTSESASAFIDLCLYLP